MDEKQESGIFDLSWSSDGKHLAVTTGSQEVEYLKIYDSITGKNEWGLKLEGTKRPPVDWSPDGKYLAVNQHYDTVAIIDTDTWKTELKFKAEPETKHIVTGYVTDVSWDPTGKYIAVTYDMGYLYLFDRHGAKQWSRRDYVAGYIKWSHSGILIAIVNWGHVSIYNKYGGKIGGFGAEKTITGMDWSSDDRYLAVGSDDNRVYLLDNRGVQVRSLDMEDEVYDVKWDTSGKYLAVTGFFGTALLDRKGSKLWVKDEPRFEGFGLDWSGRHGVLALGVGLDGLFILGIDGDILAGDEESIIDYVLWDPLGDRLAALSSEKLYLYEWSTSEVKSLPVVQQAVAGPAEPGVSSLVVSGLVVDYWGDLLLEKINSLSSGPGCRSRLFTVLFDEDVLPGEFIGSWNCCLLGCGDWGCSYRCVRDSRVVVVKVPRGYEGYVEGGVLPTVHEKLLVKVNEKARIISGLDHPNILRLLASSSMVPLLVYEYADGGSLDYQLSRGWEPSRREQLLLFIQVADALRYIHGRGLIHGDVKPSNIFFVEGIAKLGDFSTLKKLLSQTTSHSIAYTYDFRAPEQVYVETRRKAKRLGLEHMIDVYMLGNTILYVLTHETLDGEEAVDEEAVEKAVRDVGYDDIRILLKNMLNPEPWKRPSTTEIVKTLLSMYRKTV